MFLTEETLDDLMRVRFNGLRCGVFGRNRERSVLLDDGRRARSRGHRA